MSKRSPFPIREGYLPFHGHKTWYRIVGDQDKPGKLPLICLHGGPGATHDYFGSLEAFAATGRRVVLYDQIGWGNSDHIHDPSFWTMDLFVDELKAVRKALGLSRAHILGHSWGGMLALEYALTRPKGLASLVLANTLSSSAQWAHEAKRLIKQLPLDVQDVIHKNETAGTIDSPVYRAAMREYSRHYGGGHISPFPDWVKKAFKKIGTNEIYLTMWGPSEFCVTGTLKDWDVTPRLGEIQVPALVLCGRDDEATPALARTLHRGIPGSQMVIFERSAHFPHIEETELFLQVLDTFLIRAEKSI